MQVQQLEIPSMPALSYCGNPQRPISLEEQVEKIVRHRRIFSPRIVARNLGLLPSPRITRGFRGLFFPLYILLAPAFSESFYSIIKKFKLMDLF